MCDSKKGPVRQAGELVMGSPGPDSVGTIPTMSSIDPTEIERRNIARKTGRKSTMLTNQLEWPPNVFKTLLGS
jgi:hypothetical protein